MKQMKQPHTAAIFWLQQGFITFYIISLKTSDYQKAQKARYCASGLLGGLILERWATGHKMVMAQELINAHPFNQQIHQ